MTYPTIRLHPRHLLLAAIGATTVVGAALLAATGTGSHPAVKMSEFLNEHAPYPQCHASTIVETSPGRLVAAWFGGTRERALSGDRGPWRSGSVG